MFWTLLLFLLAIFLEYEAKRPFLASYWGKCMARLLQGCALGENLWEVPELPAVGFRAAAQTWGETVLIVPNLLQSPEVTSILTHEQRHVEQYCRLTSLGFWGLYLLQWLGGLLRYRNAFRAYWNMPLEAEARAAAQGATTNL